MTQQVLYVDPARGNDTQSGNSASQPLKTITAALRRSRGDTLIQLKAGQYTQNQGEQFPLTLPTGCQLVGEMGGDRPAVVLEGGGPLQTQLLGTVAVTCQLQTGAALKNVVVVNSQAQGVGLWVEAGRVHLEKVVVRQCPQAGLVAAGQALPIVQDCVFEACGQAGITFFTQSKGVLERVFCRQNQTGIRVANTAAPLVINCRLEQNTLGLAIADTAQAVLQGTRITNNQTYGVHLTGQGTADLGQAQAPGNNVIRQNGQADIRNDSGRSLVACGNDLLPQRLTGRVELVASAIPDAAAVPALLLDQPASFATPTPAPADRAVQPDDEKTEPVPVGSGQFKDMTHHWAGPFVDGLVQANAVAGYQDGTFRPDQSITRAEFASLVLANFPDRPRQNTAVPFRDVPRDFWGYKALSEAQQMGFLSGFPDDTMRPTEPITRIQAIVAVANGLGLTGGRVDDIGIYRDRAQVPSYAVDALATATQQRLVVNHPEPLQLRPLEVITRGEVSALIYQGRVAVGKSSAIASPYIVQPDATQPRFSDLTGHWAADFIRGLAEVNLASGMKDGSFAPDAPMNRAQFAALVVNAFQPPAKQSPTAFKDVPANYWGADVIQAAYRGEFMSGFTDQTFAPENPLLRVQIWVAIVSGLDWEQPQVNLQPLGRFEDYTTLPRYALPATAIAAERHLIANYPQVKQLRPNQVASRAEACVTVYQALVALKRLPSIPSPYIV